MKRPLLVGILLLFLSCGNTEENNLLSPAQRIVSLSPSITRQIIDLDAEDRLAGVTSFHPPLSRSVPVVGSIVQPNIEKIVLLKPDIVLYSLEDQSVQRMESLGSLGLRAHAFSSNGSFEDILGNYQTLASLLGKEEEGKRNADIYRKKRKKYTSKGGSKVPVVFLVSLSPLITVSDTSYISNILRDAGGRNVFGDLLSPYPKISIESMVSESPETVIVMKPARADDLVNLLEQQGISVDWNIEEVEPDTIAFYTPSDYCLSLESVAPLLHHVP